ncbi:serine/threonine protein phosphatase [Leptospira perolatii]|uniref:Serine/threonine protein phosphatase n=1 Tax=Leptospira perolatii TaxID=2023191 RepID=A0A2M9ZRG8_9LEPT|nr:PP2C family protein-serine/threonine phosphatase [Leptospira perolatii]PJZ71029.1 serine/threonine protein phosphatase [Leptospira perolatii]PJZ74561.1 serine/threonine protein phosphatase [Leptospira perolatii]
MDLISILKEDILLNYYAFGSMLSFLACFLSSLFFLLLKGKSSSTKHLALGALYLSLFQSGYFIAAMLYHPYAAYHRWLTVGFIMPAILHLGQFIARYPEDTHPKFTRILMYSMWAVAICASLFFFYVSWNAPKKFHFTAHHWDFNAEKVSKNIALIISIFVLISMVILPIWKLIITKGKIKFAIAGFMIALMTGGIIPNVTNILSRDGVIERSTFLTSIVLLLTLALFLLLVLFLNFSNEKTTFMVKIVGITFVTLMLIIQALVFISNQDKEAEYDTKGIVKMERVLEGGKEPSDMKYLVLWKGEGNQFDYSRYDKAHDLRLPQLEIDFENTLLYEKIINLPDENFRSSLVSTIKNSHEYFQGYKESILDLLKRKPQLQGAELKREFIVFVDKLDRNVFVTANKLDYIFPIEFCEGGKKYLKSSAGDVAFFRDSILSKWNDCTLAGKNLLIGELKAEVLQYFRPFQPALSRHYRKSLDETKHFVVYIHYDPVKNEMAEIGYSYRDYREFMHPTSEKQTVILGLVLFVIFFVFPLFFRQSLVTPLNRLLSGVEKVNAGNLEVQVTAEVKDEIGFLSDSFNNMVSSIRQARIELQDYAEHLAEKVKERTRELSEKMEELQRLKVQQDGDYFLTSLLAKPLFYNANKSIKVKTDFILRQKKQFEFRGKSADLGGDICVTGNLRLRKGDTVKRYTLAMNGDAMGKSMQGAGGALVMGVVVNSILARSAAGDRVLDTTPEAWLTETYNEMQSVFKSFNGSMVISATFFLVEDDSGEAWYFNAEHPFSVIYRDRRASFLEAGLTLRKIGLDSEYEFKVHKTKLEPGDVIIIGSDGKDDLDLTPDEDIRTINEDEMLFLQIVEKAEVDLVRMEELVRAEGELTDDLSILKIEFQPKAAAPIDDETIHMPFDWKAIYKKAKEDYQGGKLEEAIRSLDALYNNDPGNVKVTKLLGLLSFKGKNYAKAVEVLNQYLTSDPDLVEYWYYLSLANRRVGRMDEAILAAKRMEELQPENSNNLVNLSDLYRQTEQFELAEEYAKKVMSLEPENENAAKLLRLIERDRSSS